jgi:hypothetical protein
MYPDRVYRFAVLLALTACYRPGSEAPCTVSCSATAMDCPDGLTCNTTIGRCALASGGCLAGDAGDDARRGDAIDGPMIPDGAEPGPCVPTAAFNTFPLTQGAWFTPDLDRSPPIAVKQDANGEPVVTEGNANTVNGADYSPVFVPMAGVRYYKPRLAPSRDEMYYLQEEEGAPVVTLRRATRMGPGNWTSDIIVLLPEFGTTPIPLVGDEDIGAPTTTTPRRMLISTTNRLDEFVETGPTQWTLVKRHGTTFSGAVFLGRATLNEDGLRLVFEGQAGAANVAGYYSDRAAVGDGFGTLAIRIPSSPGDSVETPYLSEDCQTFYYTFPQSGQIQRVVFQ